MIEIQKYISQKEKKDVLKMRRKVIKQIVVGFALIVYLLVCNVGIAAEINITDIPVIEYNEWGYQNVDQLGDAFVTGYGTTIVRSESSIELVGWALDPLAGSTASKVIIQVGDRYFEAEYGIERETVVDFFQNDAYLKCGYSVELNTQELIDAQGLTVHVVSADGTYQYPPESYTVTPDTIKPVAVYEEWGYQNVDRIGDILVDGYVLALSQTEGTVIIEGWALDPLANNTASGVVIQVGDQYFRADYGRERETVAEFFHNSAYMNCGYTAELEVQTLIAAQSLKVHVISADEEYQYPPEVYSIQVK